MNRPGARASSHVETRSTVRFSYRSLLWLAALVLMCVGPIAGARAATITLAAACDTAGARQIPSDQPGTRRFERPLSLVPQFSSLRFYTFPGGCVTYDFRFSSGASPVLAGTASTAVGFVPRSRLVSYVRQTEGLALCGRGAACPG